MQVRIIAPPHCSNTLDDLQTISRSSNADHRPLTGPPPLLQSILQLCLFTTMQRELTLMRCQMHIQAPP
jgi:hypothetical protein